MTTQQQALMQAKIDITKEQSDLRHEQSANFQNTIIKLEESMDKKIDKLIERFDSFEQRLESKFAWKWTEKILIFIWSAVGIAIVGAIMTLVLKR